MLDGKMLRGATGTPMRKIERANSSFADAEPEPLTLANLMTKSLVAVICFIPSSGGFALRLVAAAGAGAGHFQQELLHVPRARRAAFGAQSAMQAHVFVFGHDAAGLERGGYVDILREIFGGGFQARAQVLLLAVVRKRDAIHRADIDAGIA